MDGREDRWADRAKRGGDTQDTRRHCCTASCSQSAAAKGRRAMPEDEANNIKQCDVREREREETFGQNRIAQTKLEVRQSVSQTRTGRQGKQREREATVFTALLQTDQWGCWIRDCVKRNTTQNIVSCRKATCTVILCLQRNKG